jgi:hypothetical protein
MCSSEAIRFELWGIVLAAIAVMLLRQAGAPWRLIAPCLGLQTMLLGNIGNDAALLTLAHVTAFEWLRWLREARGD